jgi:hypothetical protein
MEPVFSDIAKRLCDVGRNYEWDKHDQAWILSDRRCSETSSENLYGLDDQLRTLESDMVMSDEQRDMMRRMGLTAGTNLMFHGHPCAGKTSIVKHFAREHNLPIFYLQLVAVQAHMLPLALNPKCGSTKCKIVLVEDVDLYLRDTDGHERVSGHLLNALDQARAATDVLRIFYTNDTRSILPITALTRRMRRLMYFGPPSHALQPMIHPNGILPSTPRDPMSVCPIN